MLSPFSARCAAANGNTLGLVIEEEHAVRWTPFYERIKLFHPKQFGLHLSIVIRLFQPIEHWPNHSLVNWQGGFCQLQNGF
jgi:hypothetical protein